MAETQKSKPSTQGGSSKQHAAAGSKSHQGASRDTNARSQQGSSRSQSDSKSGNDKNR